MSQIPADLQYTKEHEWVAQTTAAGTIRMGITDFAQGALGDIVYVQMPKVGDAVIADKVCGEVESTKSVSEIFSPVTGTIVAINEALASTPELVNSDPYGAGWLAEISISGEPAALLSAAEYGSITG
jgi:glycine cleavage system H protein